MYSFPNLKPVCCSMSSSNCSSWPAYRFLKRQIRYFHLFQNFPQFIVIHTVKAFGIVNKAEIDVFLELLLFRWSSRCWQWSLVPLPFLNPAWTSGSSQFTYGWSLGLENFEHCFTSMWDECNCAVVWAFFGIAFLWDWNENWLNVVHWRREWQTTSVFLPWEPHEQYEKAKW